MVNGIVFFADRLPPLVGGMEMHAKYFIEHFKGHPVFPLLTTITKNTHQYDILENGNIIDFEMLSKMFNPHFLFFNSGCWIEEFKSLRNLFPQAKFIYRTGGNEILKAPLVRKQISDHAMRQKYWTEILNQNIDLMITNSTYTESRLRQLGMAIPFARCVGGVNGNALKCSKKSLQETITIFCAARFVPYKNHSLLLSIIHQLFTRGHKIRLRLAGEGPLLDKARQQARDLCIDSIVEFLGVLENEKVCFEMTQADVYMQFSCAYPTIVPGGSYIHSECMGRSILEALTAGTFVIAGRSGALEEIVPAGRGLLVELDDPVSMTNRMESIFSSIPRLSFCEDYTWTKLFKHYEEIYENFAYHRKV